MSFSAYRNQQQNVVMLNHIKRNKIGPSSSTITEENFLRKTKLDKKLTQINTNAKNGEQQIEDLISRIAEIGNIVTIDINIFK